MTLQEDYEVTDSDINRAAAELRQTLEHLLEDVIPEGDAHHMPIAKLEQTRRWDRSHRD